MQCNGGPAAPPPSSVLTCNDIPWSNSKTKVYVGVLFCRCPQLAAAGFVRAPSQPTPFKFGPPPISPLPSSLGPLPSAHSLQVWAPSHRGIAIADGLQGYEGILCYEGIQGKTPPTKQEGRAGKGGKDEGGGGEKA